MGPFPVRARPPDVEERGATARIAHSMRATGVLAERLTKGTGTVLVTVYKTAIRARGGITLRSQLSLGEELERCTLAGAGALRVSLAWQSKSQSTCGLRVCDRLICVLDQSAVQFNMNAVDIIMHRLAEFNRSLRDTAQLMQHLPAGWLCCGALCGA